MEDYIPQDSAQNPSPIDGNANTPPGTTLPAPTPPITKPRTTRPRTTAAAKAGISWLGALFLIVLALGVVGILARVFIWPRPTDSVERAVYGLLLACFSAGIVYLGLGLFPSSAVATAQLNLGLFKLDSEIWGPGATLLTVFATFMYFTGAAFQTVDARIFNPDGMQLLKNFTVTYHHPDTGQHSIEGHNGNAELRGLPVGIKEIQLTVTCPGYKAKTSGPYPIENRVVSITMIPDLVPPLATDEFPQVDPALIPDQRTVDKPPKVAPDLVTLHIQNQTGEDLKLLAWDCYRHYHPAPTLKGSSKWRTFDLKAGPPQTHESFQGTGWFVFFVHDALGKNHYLDTRSIFETRNPWLTVTKDGAAYLARFRFDE